MIYVYVALGVLVFLLVLFGLFLLIVGAMCGDLIDTIEEEIKTLYDDDYMRSLYDDQDMINNNLYIPEEEDEDEDKIDYPTNFYRVH